MNEYSYGPITISDGKAIVDIFNYYITNSFAAYLENTVPCEFFSVYMDKCRNYPTVVIKDHQGTIAGFGMLHAHNPMPTFQHTAEVTYFILPEKTGKGLGSKMLSFLEIEGKKQGISCILASISSLNEGSIKFHRKHGFEECGRFKNVVKKKGMFFDTVWMQKFI